MHVWIVVNHWFQMGLSGIIALVDDAILNHAVWHSSDGLVMAVSQIVLQVRSDVLLVLLHILYLNLAARIVH